MNLRTTLFLGVLSVLGFVQQASATTTIIFSSSSGRLSGFADLTNTPANNMRWGLIIDTAGDGFDNSFANTTYDHFSIDSSGFISTSTLGVSSVSDDYFFMPSNTPVTGDATAGTGETGTQVASITSAVGAPNGTDGLIPGVSTGDSYAIIWFPEATAAGSKYGLFTHANFTLVASGASTNRSADFAGNDPTRLATLNFTSGAAPVPEPSRLMLLGLGMAGVVFRRRRK